MDRLRSFASLFGLGAVADQVDRGGGKADTLMMRMRSLAYMEVPLGGVEDYNMIRGREFPIVRGDYVV